MMCRHVAHSEAHGMSVYPPIDVPPPPEAGGCTPAEEEDALWSIVAVCRETISARVKNASCVWETMSCVGGMSALGSWAWGVGICGLASL